MPFTTYSDGVVLFADQLNADNATSLDVNTSSPQTIQSTITVNGGINTVGLKASALTWTGSTVDNLHLITTGSGYSVSSTDRYVIVTTGATMAITLPANPTIGRLITVKEGSGASNPGAVTVNGGGALIDGQSSYVITSAWGYVQVTWSGARWLTVN